MMHPENREPYTVKPGLQVWSRYDAESRVPFWSTRIVCNGTEIVLDPTGPVHGASPDGILLTSANHERDSALWQQHFGCPRCGFEETGRELGIEHANPSDIFPAEWDWIPLPGAAVGEGGALGSSAAAFGIWGCTHSFARLWF